MNKSQDLLVLKRAIKATENRPDLAPQRAEYIRILRAHNSRVASGDIKKELEKPAKELGLSKNDMQEALLPVLKEADKKGPIKPSVKRELLSLIKEQGLLGGLTNDLYKETIQGSVKPKTQLDFFVHMIFKGLSISKTAEMLIEVLRAKNLCELAEAGSVAPRVLYAKFGLGDAYEAKIRMEEAVGHCVSWEELRANKEFNNSLTQGWYEKLVNYLTYLEDSKIFGVKLLFTIVKGVGLALLFGASLAGIKVGVLGFIKFILTISICFGWKNAAQFLRKTGIMLTALAPSVLIDIGRILGIPLKAFYMLTDKVKEMLVATKDFLLSPFTKKATEEIKHLLQTDMDFYTEYAMLSRRRTAL